jgi:trehalose 6-phosphate phosphatase
VADTHCADQRVPPLHPGDCLFVDFDGTLLELRDNPDSVHIDVALRALLRSCYGFVGGALAVVSGRPLAVLDACLAPDRFPAAGLHGLERRDSSGNTTSVPVDRAPLRDAARHLSRITEGMPMTYLEDKGGSVALHWRAAPAFETDLRMAAGQMLAQLGPNFRLLEGNCVIEILPRLASKGEVVRAFMREAPFDGRRPIFIGDDITDIAGIAAARQMGGLGIAVGERITGDYHLADVTAVHAWLDGGRNA